MAEPARVAVVTGANRGLGLETCRQLGRDGTRVVLRARDAAKGRAAAGALAGAALLLLACGVASAQDDEYAEARAALLAEIAEDARRTADWTGRPRFDDRVIEAMRKVPRHEFVPAALRPMAYANRPLPIGHGQTISQPYIVALMSDLLDTEPGQTALEIGTGSGYQAAVLAALGMRVFTIEIVPRLAAEAEERLARLGYDAVTVRSGDGYHGWPEHAPFDAIIVTAAATTIPPPLIDQLKPGGRMIIPVGARFVTQQLVLVEKDAAGTVTTRQMLPVAFVPFTRLP